MRRVIPLRFTIFIIDDHLYHLSNTPHMYLAAGDFVYTNATSIFFCSLRPTEIFREAVDKRRMLPTSLHRLNVQKFDPFLFDISEVLSSMPSRCQSLLQIPNDIPFETTA
jgi:hypothetical protein